MAAVLRIKTDSEFAELMQKAKVSIKEQTAATKELASTVAATKEETKAVAKATDDAKARAKALNNEARLHLQQQHRVTAEIQKQDFAIKAQALSLRQVEAELQKEAALQTRINLGEKDREASITRQNILLGQRARLAAAPGGGGAGGPSVVQRLAGPLGSGLGAAGLGAGGGLIGNIAGVAGVGAVGATIGAGTGVLAGVGVAASNAFKTAAQNQAEVQARTEEHARTVKEMQGTYGDVTTTVYNFGNSIAETGRGALRWFGLMSEDVEAIENATKRATAEQERLKLNAQAAREAAVRGAGGNLRDVGKAAEVEAAGRLVDLNNRGVDLETRRRQLVEEITKLKETEVKDDQHAADLMLEINNRATRLTQVLTEQQQLREAAANLAKQDADLADQRRLTEQLRGASIADIQDGLNESRATFNKMLEDGSATMDDLGRFMTHQSTLQAALTAGEDQRRAALESIAQLEKSTGEQKRVALLTEQQVTAELERQKAIVADGNTTIKQRTEALTQINLLTQQKATLDAAEQERANTRYQRAKQEYEDERRRIDELREAGVTIEDARLEGLMRLRSAQDAAFNARTDQLQKERDAEEAAYQQRMDRLNKEQAKRDEAAKKRLDALTSAFTTAPGGAGTGAGATGAAPGGPTAPGGRRNPYGGLLLQGGPLTGGPNVPTGALPEYVAAQMGAGRGGAAAGGGGSVVDRLVGQASQEDIIRRVRKDVLDAVEARRKTALEEGGDVKGINERFDRERRQEARRVNRGNVTAEESATAQKELATAVIDQAAASGDFDKQTIDALKKSTDAAIDAKAFKETATREMEKINKRLDAVMGSGSRTAAQRSGVGG